MKKRFIWYVPFLLVVLVLSACTQSTPVLTEVPKVIATPTPKLEPAPKTELTSTPKPVTSPKPKAYITPGSVPYYQGKTIEMLVGAAGGGTDMIARFTAVHLPKYIPGQPKVIVRNIPSVQGVMAANTFYEKVKPDGLTLIEYSSGTISLQLMREPMVQYDLRKFRHIGNIATAESVLMVRKAVVSKLTDSRSAPLVSATRAGTESWSALTLWGKEFLGWNVRWLPGFTATTEMELALRRGEIDIFGTATGNMIKRLVDEGVAEPVTQIGSLKGGKFTRRSDFPEVPTLEELLGNKKPSGIPWQAYTAWVGPGLLDKSLAAPQNTPDFLMAIFIDAFTKMSRDPEFVTLIKRTISDVYEVGIGEETQTMVKNILDAPWEAVEYSRSLQLKSGIIAK